MGARCGPALAPPRFTPASLHTPVFPCSFLVALPSEHGSTSPTAASKLEVGPKAISGIGFLRDAAFGPYWIVAVGQTPANASAADSVDDGSADAEVAEQELYDWAVISGGEPDSRSNGACTTFRTWLPTRFQYRGGLWLFTRQPNDEASTAAARKAAKGRWLLLAQMLVAPLVVAAFASCAWTRCLGGTCCACVLDAMIYHTTAWVCGIGLPTIYALGVSYVHFPKDG